MTTTLKWISPLAHIRSVSSEDLASLGVEGHDDIEVAQQETVTVSDEAAQVLMEHDADCWEVVEDEDVDESEDPPPPGVFG